MILSRHRGPGRFFATLLLVGVPPLLVLAALVALAPGAVERVGVWPVAIFIGLLAVAWSGIVAVAFAGYFGIAGPDASLLAAPGHAHGAGAGAETDAVAPIAATLAERNRQIALLAARARGSLHIDDPRAAVHHVVSTAREVTGDPVWALSVVSSTHAAIPAGVYGPDAEAGAAPIEDVHRWAATADRGDGSRGTRYVDGHWGAFVTVDVISNEEITAVLLAPRAGRPAPVGAESDLLALIGEYAAATIEHGMLLERVRAQAADLGRLATMQRDFLRGVTHDLQAPLTSIRALAAEASSTVADPETADDLAAISHQADRLGRMVGQLLAMSRLEGGALEPRQEVFRAEGVIRRAWRALHADRPLDLETSGVEHLTLADPDRFEQVIWALLDNAVRYSPAGSPVEVRVAGRFDGDRLVSRIEVRDHGIGLSDEDRTRAFERFYRSDRARAVAPNGSGIGLHTAAGLIAAMSGSIALEAAGGGGTRVTIELPAEEAQLHEGG
jgi:two-component system, OmpR family, sensor histidine kinase KdpD